MIIKINVSDGLSYYIVNVMQRKSVPVRLQTAQGINFFSQKHARFCPFTWVFQETALK